MKHISALADDVPMAPPLVDRRRTSGDRRARWRGGRRDTDWLNRPQGALPRFSDRHPGAWRRMLGSLHLLW